MNADEVVKALRENAEWCDANEYDVPLCMGDNQRAAADLIEALQAKLAESQRMERAAVELAGKLIALCNVPKEWRDKLFRRHVNRPGVYMGSGYDFLDGFYRLFDDFSETADEETYRAVRLVAEKLMGNPRTLSTSLSTWTSPMHQRSLKS